MERTAATSERIPSGGARKGAKGMEQSIGKKKIAAFALLTMLALALLGVGYLVEKGILDLIYARA